MSSHEPNSSLENPYAAPKSLVDEAELPTTENSRQRDLRVFVGPNANYYLEKWRPILAGEGRSAGFNWAAFFLSGMWILYRKMYRVGAIFFGIILAESVLEEVFFVGVLGQAEPPDIISTVVSLLAASICGANGNRWYLSHADRNIKRVRAVATDGASFLSQLARRGGTSFLAVLALIFVYILLIFVVFFALDLLMYPV